MKTFHLLAVVALLGVGATSAGAQGVTLEFEDGKVRLSAQNVPVSRILAEWARRGRTTIVNGERVPGPPVTLELQDVSEQQALDTLLRSASGYLVAARDTTLDGASSFDRIYILPTSTRPSNAAPLPQQPQQALQVQDDLDDEPPPPPNGPRGLNGPPGARLPRDINQPANGSVRPPVALDDDPAGDPAERQAPPPPPGNPFGVAPGTARPGVITPGPTPPANRPNQ